MFWKVLGLVSLLMSSDRDLLVRNLRRHEDAWIRHRTNEFTNSTAFSSRIAYFS